ncbi:hypothetical protein D3C80_2012780 [compost metagenome]
MGGMGLMILWNVAVDRGYRAVRDLVPPDKLSEASALVDKAEIPALMFLLFAGLSILGLIGTFLAVKMRRYLAAR